METIDFYVVILYITNLLTVLFILIIFQLVHLDFIGSIFHLQVMLVLCLFPYIYNYFFFLSLSDEYSNMTLTSRNNNWHAFLVFYFSGVCSLPFLL